MRGTSLVELASKHLAREAAAFTVMAAKAKTVEAKRALEGMAARYRELAARRAALGCLGDDDPAAPMLAHTIERLARSIGEG